MVQVDTQTPRGRDARIKLAQASGRRIARIGKERLPRFLAILIQSGKFFPAHAYFPSHFQPAGVVSF